MKWKIRIITLLLVLGWMAVIFHFSSQVAEESSDLSGHVSYNIAKEYSQVTGRGWNENQLNAVAAGIEFPVRKAAHMTEYGILALFLFFHFASYERLRGKLSYWCSLAMVFLYASSDEFHQTFVRGREGSFRDVVIDSVGALLFLLLLYAIRKGLAKRKG